MPEERNGRGEVFLCMEDRRLLKGARQIGEVTSEARVVAAAARQIRGRHPAPSAALR
jgi:hypothetical protein